MTAEEQLAYCDHLEGRLAAINARAAAFITRPYEPDFQMFKRPEIWSMPHPQDEYPNEWNRVFFGSVGAGVVLACFALMEALRRGLL